MTIRDYKPPDRALARWVRDVVAALTPAPRVAYRHEFALLPIDVKTDLTRAPESVRMVRARTFDNSLDSIISGGVVRWSWRTPQTLRIEDISSITAGTYSVVLEMQVEAQDAR